MTEELRLALAVLLVELEVQAALRHSFSGRDNNMARRAVAAMRREIMNFEWPIHPMVIASCLAALGLGYLVRHLLEESGVDVEAQIRKLFGR